MQFSYITELYYENDENKENMYKYKNFLFINSFLISIIEKNKTKAKI